MSDAHDSQPTQTTESAVAPAVATAPPDTPPAVSAVAGSPVADAAVEDNSHAGQGSVMIDIGGEIGALVVDAPASMEGVEIEIRPTGDTPYADGARPASTHQTDPDALSPADRDPGHPRDPAGKQAHEHAHGSADEHPSSHSHDHPHDPPHDHPHDHPHTIAAAHHGGSVDGHALVHVAVLKRPAPSGPRWAAVYPQLHEGTYDLYVRPAEPVALSVAITGGAVTEATWPVRPD